MKFVTFTFEIMLKPYVKSFDFYLLFGIKFYFTLISVMYDTYFVYKYIICLQWDGIKSHEYYGCMIVIPTRGYITYIVFILVLRLLFNRFTVYTVDKLSPFRITKLY